MALDFRKVADLLSGFQLMPFFPADDGARLEFAKIVADMASTEDQVKWLTKRALGLYREWPGVLEIRACFCSRFRPADGISAHSSVYLDGIPSERPAAVELPRALPPGHEVSIDAGLENDIRLLAASKDLNRIPRRRLPAAEIPTNPNYKPVTQADIDKAVNENRERRTRELLHGGTEKS